MVIYSECSIGNDGNQLGYYFYGLYRMRHKAKHKISKPSKEKYKSK